MTPKLATLKFSKCVNLLVVLRNGYKYKGILAAYNKKKKVSINNKKSNTFSSITFPFLT